MTSTPLSCDIFCAVVDNYGDAYLLDSLIQGELGKIDFCKKINPFLSNILASPGVDNFTTK